MKVQKLNWKEVIGDYGSVYYYAYCPLFGQLEINDENWGWHCIKDNFYFGAKKYKSPQHCMNAIERMRFNAIKECMES